MYIKKYLVCQILLFLLLCGVACSTQPSPNNDDSDNDHSKSNPNTLNSENYTLAVAGPGESLVRALFEDYNASSDNRVHDGYVLDPYTSYEIIDRSFDLKSQTASYTIHAQINYPLWITHNTIQLNYSFDGSWCTDAPIVYSVTETNMDYSPIIGNYYITDDYWGDEEEYQLSIKEIDEESMEITLEGTRQRVFSSDRDEWSGVFAIQQFPNSPERLKLGFYCKLDSNWTITFYNNKFYLEGCGRLVSFEPGNKQ